MNMLKVNVHVYCYSILFKSFLAKAVCMLMIVYKALQNRIVHIIVTTFLSKVYGYSVNDSVYLPNISHLPVALRKEPVGWSLRQLLMAVASPLVAPATG